MCSEIQHTVPLAKNPSVCEKGNGQDAREAEVRIPVSKGHRLGGNQSQPGASNVFPPTQAGGGACQALGGCESVLTSPLYPPSISSLGKMLTPHSQLASFPKTLTRVLLSPSSKFSLKEIGCQVTQQAWRGEGQMGTSAV